MSLWQWNDIQTILDSYDVCLNYCRGAGKTEKMSHLMVFFTLINKDAYWYASSSNQLTQLQKYLNINPFVVKFANRPQNTMATTIFDKILRFAVLTPGNASGPHVDVLFFDEVALMQHVDGQDTNNSLYDKALGCVSQCTRPYLIHFSTPIKGTLFEELVQTKPTLKHTYLDCDFMNHEFIASRKRKGLEWIWEQEYMCEFIMPTGAVFPEIFEYDGRIPTDLVNIRQGTDFNANPGHPLVRIGEKDDCIYIIYEELFRYKYDDDFFKKRCIEYPTENEDGGWNSDHAVRIVHSNVTYVPFTGDKITSDGTKSERLFYLLGKKIYVCKTLTPNVYKDLLKARWDDQGKKVDTGDLHWLAALLHAAQPPPKMIVSTKTSNTTRNNNGIALNPYQNKQGIIRM